MVMSHVGAVLVAAVLVANLGLTAAFTQLSPLPTLPWRPTGDIVAPWPSIAAAHNSPHHMSSGRCTGVAGLAMAAKKKAPKARGGGGAGFGAATASAVAQRKPTVAATPCNEVFSISEYELPQGHSFAKKFEFAASAALIIAICLRPPSSTPA